MRPTHLDLFSGIGGFALAARWAGFETVAFCERDQFCQKVLAKHWPEVPCFDDICTLTGDAIRDRGIGHIDIATGGFPCQDLSIANKTAQGLDGRRSGLWFEMLRVIEQSRPAFVVIENVPNLYRMGIDICLNGLETLGYTTRTIGLPACSVGAWHLRQRVFIVGTDTEVNVYSHARSEKQAFQRWEPSVKYSGMDTGFGERSRLFEPKLCGNIHGIPNGLDRLRSLGNAIVPQVAYVILKAIYDELRPIPVHPSR